MTNNRLLNKIALVTGSSRGIGKAIAAAYLQQGAVVVLNCKNVVEGEASLAELKGYGKVSLSIFDVGDETQVIQAFDRLQQQFGRLDVLVNNAGITRDKTLAKMTVEDWDETLRINLRGPFLCMRSALPLLNEGASVINISSVIGQSGGFGQANYAASKAGLIGLTKTAALEFSRRKVRVNAIAPGFVATDMVNSIPKPVLDKIVERIPAGRLGTVGEIAQMAVYLASDDSQYATGQVFSLNGGLYL